VKPITAYAIQVKLLITNSSFYIDQKAIAQSKTGKFRGYGLAEAPPIFQRLPQERFSTTPTGAN
jgi:hypothetical protein